MGNRYRCAGSASETYINNERVYDRVDIKSPNLPQNATWDILSAELNGLLYIYGFWVSASLWDIYTFDGEHLTKFISTSLGIQSMCTFNNTIYCIGDGQLYRLNGTSFTFVSDIPSDYHNYTNLFVLGNNLYLLFSTNTRDEINRLYRFTGSSWTEIATSSEAMFYPTCVLYNGAIHIMSYYEMYIYVDNVPVWTIFKIHKIFNGSSLTDGAQLPGDIQVQAAYVVNNKLRVFRKITDGENNVDVYELSGNTWSGNNALNFDGWANKQLLLDRFNAVYFKNEQYLLSVQGFMMIKVTNPIKMGQYFISS